MRQGMKSSDKALLGAQGSPFLHGCVQDGVYVGGGHRHGHLNKPLGSREPRRHTVFRSVHRQGQESHHRLLLE